MNFRKHLRLKHKIILSLIAFCTYTIIGMLYVSTRSSQKDKDHIVTIESLDKIEVNFYNAIIKINRNIIEDKKNNKTNIDHIINKIHLNIQRITDNNLSKHSEDKLLYILGLEVDKLLITSDLLKLELIDNIHHNFNVVFPKVSKKIHSRIKSDNRRFNFEIFVFSCILVICLLLSIIFILSLINKLITTDRLIINNTIKIEEEERNRIAMDLHDDLGAQLSSISLYAKLLEREYVHVDKIGAKIKHINSLSKQALKSAQIVISNLKPEHISKHKLITALDKFLYRNNKLNDLKFSIHSINFTIDLEKTSEIILYRISTELINNTIKHSKAQRSTIEIYNKRNIVHYIYEDDGKGFDTTANKSANSMGLQNIRKRVDMLGGICKFESEKDKGMKFTLEFNRFKK